MYIYICIYIYIYTLYANIYYHILLCIIYIYIYLYLSRGTWVGTPKNTFKSTLNLTDYLNFGVTYVFITFMYYLISSMHLLFIVLFLFV